MNASTTDKLRMDNPDVPIKTIDEYMGMFPEPVREILRTLRKTIADMVPEARETIKYRMPTFTLHGNLVHFAAYAKHIGFYPTPSPLNAFRKELAPYKTSKGAVQFPLDRPLPLPLIRKLIAYRVMEIRDLGKNVTGKRKG